MGDPQAIQSFHKARRIELCSVFGGQGHAELPAALWQSHQHGLFEGIQGAQRRDRSICGQTCL